MNTISPYVHTAMAFMVKAGIISGLDGRVNTLVNAARAKVAVICAKR